VPRAQAGNEEEEEEEAPGLRFTPTLALTQDPGHCRTSAVRRGQPQGPCFRSRTGAQCRTHTLLWVCQR